jgi:hypothetical protein
MYKNTTMTISEKAMDLYESIRKIKTFNYILDKNESKNVTDMGNIYWRT